MTPSSAPSTTPVPVSVSSIALLHAGRTNVTITVNLTTSLNMPGSAPGNILYCIGLGSSSTPTSIGAVKSASFDGSISAGAFVAVPRFSTFSYMQKVKLDGLVALQSYAIFCYAESPQGLGTDLASVISKKLSVETSCCKTLSFTNAPKFLYAGSSSYIFTYSLSAAPSNIVSVTPSIYPHDQITVSPTLTYFSKTSLISGQFYLNTSANLSGNITIWLNFSGINSHEYSNASIHVRILQPTQRFPAPMMLSSHFSESGQAAVVTFDSSTDSANIPDLTWNCSRIFSFRSASLTKCTWINSTSVKMTFGAVQSTAGLISYLGINDYVNLTSNRVKTFCTGTATDCLNNLYTPFSSVQTQGPGNPTAPTVVLIAPSSLGPLIDLTLDATGSYGSGGRLYTKVQWNVSAVGFTGQDPSSAIQQLLSSHSKLYQVSQSITILRSNLPTATYTFTLHLKNFLNAKSSSFLNSVVVNVNDDANSLSLMIIGPSYQIIVASTPLNVLSVFSPSSSASKQAAVIYQWKIQYANASAVVSSLRSISSDPSIFSLPAYSLIVDVKYLITVSVSVGILTASASISVYVAHGSLTAAVVNGYSRSANVNDDLILDASISTDTDVRIQSSSKLSYQWQCISTTSQTVSGCIFFSALKPHSSLLTIPSTSMAVGFNYSYVIIVTSRDGRSASQIVYISPIDTTSPQPLITSTFTRFNIGSQLLINCYLSGDRSVTSVWDVSSLGVSVPVIAITPTSRAFTKSEVLSQIAFPFGVDTTSLVGGRVYTFRLTVSALLPPTTTYSEITLTANSPPNSGYLSSTPIKGFALVDNFIISSSGWASNSGNFPLSFSFGYKLSALSPYLTLAVLSLRASTKSNLPAGLNSEKSMITLQGQAVDIFSASSTATTTVSVTLSVTNISGYLTSNLTSAFQAGNINLAFQTVNNVSQSYLFVCLTSFF